MIAGNQLPLVFKDPELVTKFVKILSTTKAVIVFRSSPAQKAEIVRLVRTHIKDSITLAIGDGANDVNMI